MAAFLESLQRHWQWGLVAAAIVVLLAWLLLKVWIRIVTAD